MLCKMLSSAWHWKQYSKLTIIAGILCTAVYAASEDYFVHSLPGISVDEPLVKMHAGRIQISPNPDRNMFFWLFENEHIADRSRLIIWLNGGPGCSSEDGALMEIGPYRVRSDGSLERNEGSWNEFANLLFVDSPVGTGYSYTQDGSGLVHELDEAANHLIQFLEKWFAIFPEHSQEDIYIAGESYAGQFIPYLAKAILARKSDSLNQWNVKGLLIGNGWLSGAEQYPAYLSYAYENGLLTPGTEQAQAVEEKQALCLQSLSQGGNDHVANVQCENVLKEIIHQTAFTDESSQRLCYNMYDVRIRDQYPNCGLSWPLDLQFITPYLRRDDVMSSLHIDPTKQGFNQWQECSGAVGSAFKARNSVPSVKLLPELLGEIPILLYSGDQDLTNSYIGTENLINVLEWNGGVGFGDAPRLAWKFNDESAGYYQEARNLTYVRFYDASIMVPYSQPRRSRDMLDRFMGVNIASIGGQPVESVIGGIPNAIMSVGAIPNMTEIQQDHQNKIGNAYKQSGVVAFAGVIFLILVIWLCTSVRQRRIVGGGYISVFTRDPDKEEETNYRDDHDLEARDFDEHELEDLASSNEDVDSLTHNDRLSVDEGTSDGEKKFLVEKGVSDAY